MDGGAGGRATVQVWVVPLLVPADVLASLVASLGPDEQARAGRYRSPDDARRFSAARGWLRHVLGAATGSSPAELRLASGPGKPRLAGRAGPRFNLSHAGEVALIAVADREVGVDVEPWGHGRRALDAVPLACTPAERDALSRLGLEARAEAFLALWTAKEAYLKATGAGLAVAPDRVTVGSSSGAGTAPVGVVGDDGAVRWSGWSVRRVPPVPGYLGAVAAEGADWVVRLRRPSELAPAAGASGAVGP